MLLRCTFCGCVAYALEVLIKHTTTYLHNSGGKWFGKIRKIAFKLVFQVHIYSLGFPVSFRHLARLSIAELKQWVQ